MKAVLMLEITCHWEETPRIVCNAYIAISRTKMQSAQNKNAMLHIEQRNTILNTYPIILEVLNANFEKKNSHDINKKNEVCISPKNEYIFK